jgi:hypothetical protein
MVDFIGKNIIFEVLKFKVFYNGNKGCDDMLQSNSNTSAAKVQRIYFIVSWSMVLISSVLFILGYSFTKAVQSAPRIILLFATYLLYYHLAHIIFGIGSLFYYIGLIRKKLISMKITKTIFGILFTPVSAIILYMAILLLALSNCSGS